MSILEDLKGPLFTHKVARSLADMVAMSPRNLSRVFKEKTGPTILEYLTQLRLEKATKLMNNPEYTLEYIAQQCGFKTSRQLQRILKEKKVDCRIRTIFP